MKMSIRLFMIAVLPFSILSGCQSSRATQSAAGGAPPAERYTTKDHERAMLAELNRQQSNRTAQSATGGAPPPERYTTADHERAMLAELKRQREQQTGQMSASARDNQAIRESMADKPIRSHQTQSSTSTINEMPGGQAMSEQSSVGQQSMEREPAVIEERTVVIVPVVPREEAMIEPRDRSSEEAGLRQGAESSMPGTDLDVADIAPYEPDFRQNYEANYANSGYGYDQYRPAYQYGFGLAKDPRYTTMDWNELEMKAHRNWNEGTMGPWDRYKDAVRYGWERGREATPGRG